jgi:hypothetical protein
MEAVRSDRRDATHATGLCAEDSRRERAVGRSHSVPAGLEDDLLGAILCEPRVSRGSGSAAAGSGLARRGCAAAAASTERRRGPWSAPRGGWPDAACHDPRGHLPKPVRWRLPPSSASSGFRIIPPLSLRSRCELPRVGSRTGRWRVAAQSTRSSQVSRRKPQPTSGDPGVTP